MQGLLEIKPLIGKVKKQRSNNMESKNTNKHRLGTLQDPETIRMAKHIPFWPETVAVKQLAQDCGFSINGVESRMASCHTDFLIFNDGSIYSRLKPDLSNL